MDKALAFFVMDDDNVHMIDDAYLLKVAKKTRGLFSLIHLFMLILLSEF